MHRHRKEVEELRHELTHPIHSSVPYQGFFFGSDRHDRREPSRYSSKQARTKPSQRLRIRGGPHGTSMLSIANFCEQGKRILAQHRRQRAVTINCGGQWLRNTIHCRR